MKTNLIPQKFLIFQDIFNIIEEFSPAAISIVGSHGDPNKTPRENSDLDLIFVFDTPNIFKTYKEITSRIKGSHLFYLVELGVHYQFGYIISIYTLSPLLWIDIGIMDPAFASHYLIDLPQKPILGTILPPQNFQYPLHNQNHLARKILKLMGESKLFRAKEAAYRYISWRLLELRLLGRDSSSFQLEYDNLEKQVESFSDDDALEFVLADIRKRQILQDPTFK